MLRDAVLARLRSLEGALRGDGVSALYLFGSVARGEAGADSDIDIAFDVPPTTRFSLFDEARIRNMIADELRVEVDLVPLEGLKPILRRRIEADMIRIF